MENLGTELYDLVNKIKATGSDLANGFTEVFPHITSGFDSIFASINEKIGSIQIDISGKDEIGILAGALNHMVINLRRMFREINNGAYQINPPGELQ